VPQSRSEHSGEHERPSPRRESNPYNRALKKTFDPKSGEVGSYNLELRDLYRTRIIFSPLKLVRLLRAEHVSHVVRQMHTDLW
jgi:hypothetical protein